MNSKILDANCQNRRNFGRNYNDGVMLKGTLLTIKNN